MNWAVYAYLGWLWLVVGLVVFTIDKEDGLMGIAVAVYSILWALGCTAAVAYHVVSKH